MIEDAYSELLTEGLSDMLELSWVISVTSRQLGKDPHDERVMDPTLEVIGDLLTSGYVIAGDVVKNDEGLLCVRSWKLSPSDTVKRIEQEWRGLDEPPNLGDIVWLELTEAGRDAALRLSTDNG